MSQLSLCLPGLARIGHDQFEQCAEQVGTTVDVANGVDTKPLRGGGLGPGASGGGIPPCEYSPEHGTKTEHGSKSMGRPAIAVILDSKPGF